MIDVTIIEDDYEIRESLALLISGTRGFSCKKSYGDCETALADIERHTPDVILMDIELPGMSGIEGIRQIKARFPEIDILMLTVHGNEQLVFESLCAGACGYLMKDTPPAKLLDAIEDVYNGGAPMSTTIARMVVSSFQVTQDSPLTKRETEVLSHLGRGKSYKMIADALFISEETVRRHLKNIYKKLEVHSKNEAVAKALREKWISA